MVLWQAGPPSPIGCRAHLLLATHACAKCAISEILTKSNLAGWTLETALFAELRDQSLVPAASDPYAPPTSPRRVFGTAAQMERWQSGRMYLTRNQACVQAHRGFESHPLRQQTSPSV